MNIDKLIGNTPMIRIKAKYNNKIVNVYAKLEYYNYSGSIKDRLANYIIKESYNIICILHIFRFLFKRIKRTDKYPSLIVNMCYSADII